jgi:hypothetical protein
MGANPLFFAAASKPATTSPTSGAGKSMLESSGRDALHGSIQYRLDAPTIRMPSRLCPGNSIDIAAFLVQDSKGNWGF